MMAHDKEQTRCKIPGLIATEGMANCRDWLSDAGGYWRHPGDVQAHACR